MNMKPWLLIICLLFAGCLSLMPEGLEKTVTPQEMADLLAFLLQR